VRARKARLPDVDAIHTLIQRYSVDGTLLPRSRSELCENVRDFFVAEEAGQIVGCGALHIYGTHLTEIRSICVHPELQGKGAGGILIRELLGEAEEQGVSCVCLFTRIPDYFAQFGFRVANRTELPDKIYKDCVKCPRLHACDEVAMVRGEIPKMAALPTAVSLDVLLPRLISQ
jgi:amino-acid N-acetyltransferase